MSEREPEKHISDTPERESCFDERELQAAIEFVRTKIKIHIYTPEEKEALSKALDSCVQNGNFDTLPVDLAGDMYFAMKERGVSGEQLQSFVTKLSSDPKVWFRALHASEIWTVQLAVDRLFQLPLSLSHLITFYSYAKNPDDLARIRTLLEKRPFDEWKQLYTSAPERHVRTFINNWWNQDPQKKLFLTQSGLSEQVVQVLGGQEPPKDLSPEEKASVCIYLPSDKKQISDELQKDLGQNFSDWTRLFDGTTRMEIKMFAAQHMVDTATTLNDLMEVFSRTHGTLPIFTDSILGRMENMVASFEEWKEVGEKLNRSNLFTSAASLHLCVTSRLFDLASTYAELADAYEVAPKHTLISNLIANDLIDQAVTFDQFFRLLHWIKEPAPRNRIMNIFSCGCVPLDKQQLLQLLQYVTRKDAEFVCFLADNLLTEKLNFQEAMAVLRNVPEDSRFRDAIFQIFTDQAGSLHEITSALREIPEDHPCHQHILQKIRLRSDIPFREWLALCPLKQSELKNVFVEMLQKTARTFGEQLLMLPILNDALGYLQRLLSGTTDPFELMCLYEASGEYPEIRTEIIQKLGVFPKDQQ